MNTVEACLSKEEAKINLTAKEIEEMSLSPK
jgi:hypothetical protein